MARVRSRWVTAGLVVATVAGVLVGIQSGVAHATCEFPREISIVGAAPRYEGTSSSAFATTTFTFTVTSRYCSQPGTVTFGTLPVMADGGSDFYETSGKLVFNVGDMSDKYIHVKVRQDAVRERNETFGVWLCSPTGGVGIKTRLAGSMILNDDGPTIPGRWDPEMRCSE